MRRLVDIGAGWLLPESDLRPEVLAVQLETLLSAPERLEAACAESGLQLELRRHAGYDHGYYFISTFIEEHLRFHASRL